MLLIATSAALAQQIPIDPNLYPPNADAHKEIEEALHQASAEHKRVILMFGFQRCPDCHVLNYRFHQEPAKSILVANYILVHVDVGHYDKNMDLAQKYEIPLKKGVPALAVLDSNGKLLYSQKNGEFESARTMDPAPFTAFLEKWKPAR
ncbi:MAG TPA: thioredoxin family protein [candidate division Zixibacteria bacterium]|nr:thioredoxin family protein [candidate division Zixibacteria bacterium]